MTKVEIVGGFAEWRRIARALVLQGHDPEGVVWEDVRNRQIAIVSPGELLTPADHPNGPLRVPKAFVRLADVVSCHSDPQRWARLYRVLWRLTHGEKRLLDMITDDDVQALSAMAKAVRRDYHKMTAFVRFRATPDGDGQPWFVAWFEPDDYIVERVAPFFSARFSNMRWSILTPKGCAHWNDESLHFTPGIDKPADLTNEPLEQLWRTYYASIFNPARLKIKAMQKEMPKKYWRNLPETELINELVHAAPRRVEAMIKAEHQLPRKRLSAKPRSLADPDDDIVAHDPASRLRSLRAAAASCQACPLWEDATQTVFGEGRSDAEIMLIGEQPGDEEDIRGKPFVGPAGRLLDRALAAAGIERDRLYVTNAVKHFKWEPRGKRRIHKTPAHREIEACQHWLEAEIEIIKPRIIVCMGATAARGVTGRNIKISAARGRLLEGGKETSLLITTHPSSILRTPEPDRAAAFQALVNDLRLIT